MKIIEVKTKPDKKEFLDFPKELYKEDPSGFVSLIQL
jgi:hypothetical protein